MTGSAGTVVVVTGAAGGIGRSIVRRLASDGARVACVDVDASGAAEAAAAHGDRAVAIRADITARDEVRAMVRQVEATWGPVDVLVNNAGRTRVGPFVDSRPDHWEELLRVDVLGVFHCTQEILAGMLARRTGCIVNIGSDAERIGLPGQVVYAAAKGAIGAFTRSLAREVAPHVRVNAVSPGPVRTPPLERLFERDPALARSLTAAIPLGRVAEPDDVAAAVAFLASADAAYITGQILSVSGGWAT